MKEFGFIRVAAIVPQLKVAAVKFNVTEIEKQLAIANSQGVHLATLPELCITGYTCADLFQQELLQQQALKGLKQLVKQSQNWDLCFVVGLPLKINHQLFNVAAVVQKGKVLGVVPKTFLPNYREFYEKRWFSSAFDSLNESVELFGEDVPFGTDLVFQNKTEKHFAFAVEICEDAWAVVSPSKQAIFAGATIVVNLSASNELVQKYEQRQNLIGMQSYQSICAYVYSSCGINESTSDLVFSGHSMICEHGKILKEGKRFSFESEMIFEDIDCQKLNHLRNQTNSFYTQSHHHCRIIDFACNTVNTKLNRKYDCYPFVPSSDAKRKERCEEILKIQASGLAKRLKHIGSYKTVIGISGGLDSTLALLVIAEANKMLNASNQNIIAITMPGFGTSGRTHQNARKLMQNLGVTSKEISIKDACSLHLKEIGHSGAHDITYENVQARERTQILMDVANQENAIVIGTGNLSELMLGWATYNGDHMSMYSVNHSIPKTLVQYLVKYVADERTDGETKQVLYDILDTPISPELLPTTKDDRIVQKTEESIGAYALHDFFTYHFLRYGASPKKIAFLAQDAFDGIYGKAEIMKTLKIFYKRFFQNQFKRNCMPDGAKVGSISLSPRGDWRMPSDADASIWLSELNV